MRSRMNVRPLVLDGLESRIALSALGALGSIPADVAKAVGHDLHAAQGTHHAHAPKVDHHPIHVAGHHARAGHVMM